MRIVQLCPKLNTGGVERGVVDVAIYLKKIGYESVVISNGGKLESELLPQQIRHINLPIHSKNPILFMLNLWRLKHLLTILEPNLLLPYSRIPTWLIYLLHKKMQIPFVSHCLGIHRMGGLGIKKKYNAVLMYGARIIANSDFTKNYFLNHYPNTTQKITVIHRSVDVDFFNQREIKIEFLQQLRKQWRVPAKKTVVLLPARFAYWKGQAIFIRTLGLLKKANNMGFYGVMVGRYDVNSSYYKSVLKLLTELDLIDDVCLAGDYPHLRDAYAAADIVVSASIQPEAFGRTIIEAQAMRKLVVASKHGGALETIKDRVTGFLVEPDNPKALAETLIEIENLDPLTKDKIAINAENSASVFSKERMCKHLVNLYGEIIKPI